MLRRNRIGGSHACSLLTASAIAACALGCSSEEGSVQAGARVHGPDASCRSWASRRWSISSLAIADFDEGFDLDLDGKPDNKLAPLGSLANDTIRTRSPRSTTSSCPSSCSATKAATSTCTKFAFYVGRSTRTATATARTRTWDARRAGDCDDTDRDDQSRRDRGSRPTASTTTATATPTTPTPGIQAHRHHGSRRRRLLAGAGRLRRSRRRRSHRDGQAAPSGRDGHLRRRHRSGLRRHPRQRSACDPFKAATTSPSTSSRSSFDASMNPLIAFKDGNVKAGRARRRPRQFSLRGAVPEGHHAQPRPHRRARADGSRRRQRADQRPPRIGPDGMAGGLPRRRARRR